MAAFEEELSESKHRVKDLELQLSTPPPPHLMAINENADAIDLTSFQNPTSSVTPDSSTAVETHTQVEIRTSQIG